MPAKVETWLKSLSRIPRLSHTKSFVENEEFEISISIANEDSQPFPPSDMWIEFKVQYTAPVFNRLEVNLAKGQLTSGEVFSFTGKRKALLPGSAMLQINYRPYGQGNVLLDSSGDEINPLSQDAIESFYAVSRTEIYTLRVLYVAILAAILSGLGLLITALRP